MYKNERKTNMEHINKRQPLNYRLLTWDRHTDRNLSSLHVSMWKSYDIFLMTADLIHEGQIKVLNKTYVFFLFKKSANFKVKQAY